MKKKVIYLAILLLSCIHLSCKKTKNSKQCYQVKVISNYCPKTGSVLVSFTKANPDATPIKDNNNKIVAYQAALLNVPEEFQIAEKTFYVTYHYDAELSKPDAVACPAIFGVVKILVSDSISNEDCNK